MTPVMSTEPLKVYPYHLLMTSNYRLPADVDRNNLEVREYHIEGNFCVQLLGEIITKCFFSSIRRDT